MYLAAAFLVAMPFFLLVVDYPSVVDPTRKVALLASHHWSMHAMYLITYVVFGIVLAVLVLALHERLRSEAPALTRITTTVGLMWALMLVASGMVFNAGMAAVVDLYPKHSGQAVATWQAIEPVAQGLGGSGGELFGGLWVQLVSYVGLRGRRLPRSLSWLGLAVGIVGLISVVPPLSAAGIAFGLLLIIWLIWLGIVLLRTESRDWSTP